MQNGRLDGPSPCGAGEAPGADRGGLEEAGEVLEPGFSEEQKRRVESAKRGVWSQPGAGQEYQFFAYKASPLLRLKNLVEISFVVRHVTGPSVLDAGAGTGHG